MDAARAGIEYVADSILGREAPRFREDVGVGLTGRREGVIEDEYDAAGIEDGASAHLVFEDLRDQIGTEIVQNHAIHVGDDNIARHNFFLAAGFGQDLLDHVHSGKPCVTRAQWPRYSRATATEYLSPSIAPRAGRGAESPVLKRSTRSSAPARRNARSRSPENW